MNSLISLIKQTLTPDERIELYQIGKQYYYDREIGPKFQEWVALTKIPYHQHSRKDFQLMPSEQDNGILGYTISTVTRIKNTKWRKVIEGGISSSSNMKKRDFVAMFDYFIKKEKENLIIEVGEKEETIYHILTKSCGFKPFNICDFNEASQVMETFLNNVPFKLSSTGDGSLRIKRETRQIQDYQARLLYWKSTSTRA